MESKKISNSNPTSTPHTHIYTHGRLDRQQVVRGDVAPPPREFPQRWRLELTRPRGEAPSPHPSRVITRNCAPPKPPRGTVSGSSKESFYFFGTNVSFMNAKKLSADERKIGTRSKTWNAGAQKISM